MNNPSDPSEEVRRLICDQVPEIAQGKVQIKGIVRDRSYGTIVAVHSTDAQLHAVGVVVGERGVRIKAVVKQLNNEKIDVVRWEESTEDFLRNLFYPALVSRVLVDRELNRVTVFAPSDQLALITGARGPRLELITRLVALDQILLSEDR